MLCRCEKMFLDLALKTFDDYDKMEVTNSYVDALIYENDYFRSYMFCPETALYIGKW
jgi:hypothetical protein